jgi:hypothetical protein
MKCDAKPNEKLKNVVGYLKSHQLIILFINNKKSHTDDVEILVNEGEEENEAKLQNSEIWQFLANIIELILKFGLTIFYGIMIFVLVPITHIVIKQV